MFFSAYQMLGLANDPVSLNSLLNAIPNELKELNNYINSKNINYFNARLKIESLYEEAIRLEAEDVEELRRDEALILPIDLDYNL